MLKKILPDQELEPAETEKITEEAKKISGLIEKSFKKSKIDADLFFGGSFAKGTMMRKEMQDIDLFARFANNYNEKELSVILEKAIKDTKLKYIKIHGSRDYFRVSGRNFNLEIIPVYKIASPSEARNVTDLSFFHVEYVRKKLGKNPGLVREILLAKSFCYAQNFYGAESYINGFSGYALELLIIYYKSFMNFIKKIDSSQDKIFIDIEKNYKNKEEIMMHLNPSRLQSPIILIDPTFKERNALAALSERTFLRFKDACTRFLKKPSSEFFVRKEFDKNEFVKKAKTKRAEFVSLSYSTDRQEGDIAGTKLNKFHRFVIKESSRFFEFVDEHFAYDEKKSGSSYFILKPKTKIIVRGPPVTNTDNLKKFKEIHNDAYIKGNFAFYQHPGYSSFSDFLKNWKEKNKLRIKEMGILEVVLVTS
ncbi:nucleotidyltransferase domain-containing protein [Candidatus Pacearchaeota archaeon]|nr:nucleotidyltransferase domain-containing protein [Candidatus Pacearchaeota archaeon]